MWGGKVSFEHCGSLKGPCGAWDWWGGHDIDRGIISEHKNCTLETSSSTTHLAPIAPFIAVSRVTSWPTFAVAIGAFPPAIF